MVGITSITPEQLHALLERVLQEAPPLEHGTDLSDEDLRWLARAEALVEASGAMGDQVEFRTARQSLGGYHHNRRGIISPLLNCYYRAELKMPPSAQGRFIPAGDMWGGYAALVKLVERPCDHLLIVDPYLDATVFTDILPHARARKSARCLTTKNTNHGALVAAAGRWTKDAEGVPVELRYASKNSLHDRILFLDVEAWDVSQSLKDLARRSPASLSRSDAEMGKLKLAHYEATWQSSTSVL